METRGMQLRRLGFREYFHQYVVLEADALTEKTKPRVDVSEDDCYMLCSSFISREGILLFNVLAIGDAWDHCRKGLEQDEMLAVFTPGHLRSLNARRIRPDRQMQIKNEVFIETQERDTPEGVRLTRQETVIDDLRDDFCPDILVVGINEEKGICEYSMQAESFEGPFLLGRLLEEPKSGGYAIGELLYTLPYEIGEMTRLLTVFHGNHLSEEDEKKKDALVKEGNAAGFGFSEAHRQLRGVLE